MEPEPEPEEGVSEPPARTPVREYYPSWVTRLLASINIRPKGSSKNFTSLRNKLKSLTGEVCWTPRSSEIRDAQPEGEDERVVEEEGDVEQENATEESSEGGSGDSSETGEDSSEEAA